MTIYASRTPESMNADPFPNVWTGHSEHNQMRADTDMFRKGAPRRLAGYVHRPRPAYTPAPTHSANPILVAFRAEPDIDLWDMGFAMSHSYGGQKDWDEPGHYFHCLTIATPEQIDHARRVLTRLATIQASSAEVTS